MSLPSEFCDKAMACAGFIPALSNMDCSWSYRDKYNLGTHEKQKVEILLFVVRSVVYP